jgi:hypothetical protein
MARPTVYIETTVVSYLTAWPSRDLVRNAHQLLTREWWQQQRQNYDLYVSPMVLHEAAAGDPVAAAERIKALEDLPVLTITDAAIDLAERLAIALRLPDRARADATHLAIAAVHGISFLLTWNCTHLANANFTDIIQETCEDMSYAAPHVCTPEQLMERP